MTTLTKVSWLVCGLGVGALTSHKYVNVGLQIWNFATKTQSSHCNGLP